MSVVLTIRKSSVLFICLTGLRGIALGALGGGGKFIAPAYGNPHNSYHTREVQICDESTGVQTKLEFYNLKIPLTWPEYALALSSFDVVLHKDCTKTAYEH